MKVQVKNNTQSAQSTQSARSAQSAVCSLHGLRFNMTGFKEGQGRHPWTCRSRVLQAQLANLQTTFFLHFLFLKKAWVGLAT